MAIGYYMLVMDSNNSNGTFSSAAKRSNYMGGVK